MSTQHLARSILARTDVARWLDSSLLLLTSNPLILEFLTIPATEGKAC
ncbi:MAG TPA: hypothetical protein V6D11_18020 [Waterburya sp.]